MPLLSPSPTLFSCIEGGCAPVQPGLVINLTNTQRYYEPREFENAGVAYMWASPLLNPCFCK